MCCTRWVCHHLCKTWKDGEERGIVGGCAGEIVCGEVARLRCVSGSRLRDSLCSAVGRAWGYGHLALDVGLE